MFYRGQKVTRVLNEPFLTVYGRDPTWIPKFGEVYTILDLAYIGDREFLLFAQDPKYGYAARDFRPVVEKSLPECLTRFLDQPNPIEHVKNFEIVVL